MRRLGAAAAIGHYESRTALDIEDEAKEYVDALGKPYKRMYELFAQAGADEAGPRAGIQIVWKLEGHPEIERYLAKDLHERGKLINETTAQAVRQVLIDNLHEGTQSVTDKINALYDGMLAGRGENIARTETARAQSAAGLEGYREVADEAGVEMMKEWIAELDDRVRDTHAEADGQTVGLDEDFIVGGDSMQGPGMGSDPGENVNCRCSVAPVVG